MSHRVESAHQRFLSKLNALYESTFYLLTYLLIRLVTRCALQSRMWQLIGMSRRRHWFRAAAGTDNQTRNVMQLISAVQYNTHAVLRSKYINTTFSEVAMRQSRHVVRRDILLQITLQVHQTLFTARMHYAENLQYL